MTKVVKSIFTAVRPRVEVWLEIRGDRVFCSEMCLILQAIDKTGSIKHASANVGLSYRYVWGRLNKIEQSVQMLLVTRRVGGTDSRRAELTAAGRALVESFIRLQQTLVAATDDCTVKLLADLKRAAT